MCVNILLLKEPGCIVTFYSVSAPIKYTYTLQKVPQNFRFIYKCSADSEFETTASQQCFVWHVPTCHTFVLLERAILGWRWAWSTCGMTLPEENLNTATKPSPVLLYPAQTPGGLTRDRTRAFMMTVRRLTARAMVRNLETSLTKN